MENLLNLDTLITKTGRPFSPEVVAFARKELENSTWKDTATKMGYMIAHPDYLELSGAMLIEYIKVHGPESIDHYVEVMKERLEPQVVSFMINHEPHLTALMKKYEHQDYDFNYFAASVLKGMYLARPSYDEDVFESPSYFYLRVVVGLFFDWKEGDPVPCDALGTVNKGNDMSSALQWIDQVYAEALHKRVAFATPTLFSSGFKKSQKASCFLIQIGDNLDDILLAVNKMGQISKHRGGIGFDISRVRHSDIGSIGMSAGTRTLLLLYDKLLRYADQTGVRKGRGTVYQRPQHPDILDFATIVDVDERGTQESTPNLDNAFWMNWMFFKRLKGDKGGKWTLFCPAKTPSLNDKYGVPFIKEYERLEALYEEWRGKEGILKEYIRGAKGIYKAKLEEQLITEKDPLVIEDLLKRTVGVREEEKGHYKFLLGLVKFTKQIHVDDIMRKITEMQRKWGRPYILNGDACNFKSNQRNLGYISCSNLCTEIVEYTDPDEIACCNLGSLNLGAYVTRGAFDFDLLGKNTRMMVNVLNRVIDNNFYPVEQAKNSNLKHRPIGLGVCGWGDALNKLRLPVESEGAMLLNKKIAACIYYNSLLASSYLGFKQGNYSTFQGSPMNRGKFQFDLWQDEYRELEKEGLLNPKVRRWEDQLPLDPSEWGQKIVKFGDKKLHPLWESLRYFTKDYMRNSLLVARMPTASSASLSSATESAEIHSSNIYSRNVLSVSSPVVNKSMQLDLMELGLWNTDTIDFIRCCDGSISKLKEFIAKFPTKVPDFDGTPENIGKLEEIQEIYKTIWEISQKVFIRHAAQAGIYICQSHSFNIYLPDPSAKQLKGVMLEGADIGLKTLNYYVRSLPAAKPNANTVDPAVEAFAKEMRSAIFYTNRKKEPKSAPAFCAMEEGCVVCSS